MNARIISSLEKCFLDESVMSKSELKNISLLKNERYSFQVCFNITEYKDKEIVYFNIDSPLNDCIKVYKVENIPSMYPVYPTNFDDNYLRTEAGLYPDLLRPLSEKERISCRKCLSALWVELEPQSKFEAGVYPFRAIFTNEEGEEICEVKTEIEIISAELPKQELIYSQWFYTDCLMQYYDVPTWSEKHWEIIENFMKNTVKYGMNMILTPVLSPELDTYVGGYRPTTQLVEIELQNGEYRFDFSRLKRWVQLCDKVGIEYFEINHFFSQWGAKACPQVVAKVNGEEKRIFGWDTASDSEEYKEFLGVLIPETIEYLKNLDGADKRCYFHVSDEPSVENIDDYEKASKILKPLIKGYPIIDALSDYEIYKTGAVDIPVPAVDHADVFINHNVPKLWTYYCCAQWKDVSNRFFSMPSARNRIIGVQLYKFNISAFLHWGYNFYNSQFSYRTVNPFICSDGECFAPSGDAYSVYPGENGEAWPSLRQVVFAEALQDVRALKLCEKLCGREFTMNLVEEGLEPITFKKYPKEAEYILNLRNKINVAIKNNI